MLYLYIFTAIQAILIAYLFTKLEKFEHTIFLLEKGPTASMVRIEYEARLRVLEESNKIGGTD